jgi:hypothetical protein
VTPTIGCQQTASRTCIILPWLLALLLYKHYIESQAMPGTTLLLLALIASASASAWPTHLAKRAITTNAASLDGQSFDYVVVGCGTAGLTVAGRLSEASSATSVLCIEAGPDDSDVQDRILAPAMAYYNGVAYNGSAYGQLHPLHQPICTAHAILPARLGLLHRATNGSIKQERLLAARQAARRI